MTFRTMINQIRLKIRNIFQIDSGVEKAIVSSLFLVPIFGLILLLTASYLSESTESNLRAHFSSTLDANLDYSYKNGKIIDHSTECGTIGLFVLGNHEESKSSFPRTFLTSVKQILVLQVPAGCSGLSDYLEGDNYSAQNVGRFWGVGSAIISISVGLTGLEQTRILMAILVMAAILMFLFTSSPLSLPIKLLGLLALILTTDLANVMVNSYYAFQWLVTFLGITIITSKRFISKLGWVSAIFGFVTCFLFWFMDLASIPILIFFISSIIKMKSLGNHSFTSRDTIKFSLANMFAYTFGYLTCWILKIVITIPFFGGYVWKEFIDSVFVRTGNVGVGGRNVGLFDGLIGTIKQFVLRNEMIWVLVLIVIIGTVFSVKRNRTYILPVSNILGTGIMFLWSIINKQHLTVHQEIFGYRQWSFLLTGSLMLLAYVSVSDNQAIRMSRQSKPNANKNES